MRKALLAVFCLPFMITGCGGGSAIDGGALIASYVNEFNSDDEELYMQKFPNDKALGFLTENIPVFECPDKELEKTYYFRWWTFRKHIKEIPQGYIISEFLPDVPWAGKYNAISCAASHHLAEGRWLHDSQYLDAYARFWVSEDGSPRNYSFPAADATLKLYQVHPDRQLIEDTYPGLKEIFAAWEADHKDPNGLFWQIDDRDGMEVSVSGDLCADHRGYRATINSYMYADAMALAEMARILGKADEADVYEAKAVEIKSLMDEYLWDGEARFYKVIPRDGRMEKSPVREEHGFVPWVYDIPDADKTEAWLQLKDPQGFKAPYGPTTAEQRAEGFKVAYEGHECQWNGPSWPFATTQTLTGLANTLHRFGEGVMTKADYYEALSIYSNSHRRVNESGRTVCWIDENLNPFTGDWISRTLLQAWNNQYKERGKDYNHSAFCDLVISGLIGVQPRTDGSIAIEPLVPEDQWDYFCLQDLDCAGRNLTILYDKDGRKYHRGKGFRIYVNGEKVFTSDTYATKAII